MALAMVFVAGLGLALQVFLNGRLAHNLGAPELAGLVNNSIGLAMLLIVGTATGAWRRIRGERVPLPPRLRAWHLMAGFNGALFITVTAYAAPRVGVALLTVAVVCGQSVGSLGVDRAGLSPAGKRPLSLYRVLGVLLAVVSVALGVIGAHGNLEPAALALVFVAGAGLAFQSAAMGHIARVTGEPVAGATINFTGGTLLLVVVVLITSGGHAPNGWSAPAPQWLAGFVGASVSFVIARSVGRLGVLQLILALVAGQTAGALFFDIVAPPQGEHVTVLTVLSVLLTVSAVFVSGIQRAPGRMRRARALPSDD